MPIFKNINLTSVDCPLCSFSKHRAERYVRGYPVERSWRLVKCKRCGFVYVNPRLSELDTKVAYHGSSNLSREFGIHPHASEKQENNDPPRADSYDRILHNFQLLGYQRGRILDVGCGAGGFLHFAQKRGWDVYGQDLGERAELGSPDFPVFIGELKDAPWPVDYFDVIINIAVMEHLWNPLKTIREMHRLLQPGGLFACLDIPNYRSLSIVLGRSSFFRNHPPGHLNYFTPKTLQKIAKISGFIILKTTSHGVDIVELLGGNRRIMNYGENASEEIKAIRNNRKSKHLKNPAVAYRLNKKTKFLQRLDGANQAKKMFQKTIDLLGVGGSLGIYCRKPFQPPNPNIDFWNP